MSEPSQGGKGQFKSDLVALRESQVPKTIPKEQLLGIHGRMGDRSLIGHPKGLELVQVNVQLFSHFVLLKKGKTILDSPNMLIKNLCGPWRGKIKVFIHGPSGGSGIVSGQPNPGKGRAPNCPSQDLHRGGEGVERRGIGETPRGSKIDRNVGGGRGRRRVWEEIEGLMVHTMDSIGWLVKAAPPPSFAHLRGSLPRVVPYMEGGSVLLQCASLIKIQWG